MDKVKYDFYCEEALTGKIPIEKVYESDNVLAFHHTKPICKTHIVIIPKEHILDLTSLEEKHKDLFWEIITVAQDIIKKLDIEKDGARLLTNLGKYQDTPHLHFHILSGEEI